MTIRSSKTEHHEGKESRVMPIFPELRPYLEEVYELAPEGTKHVITRYRKPNSNLRTQLHRIIRKAGLKPWPKPFQNLRSTRETELAERFPIHVVCGWLGNSPAVATDHYLQTTDDHFEQAISEETGAQHKAQQQTSVTTCNDLNVQVSNSGNTDDCNTMPVSTVNQVGDTRLELVTPSLSSNSAFQSISPLLLQ